MMPSRFLRPKCVRQKVDSGVAKTATHAKSFPVPEAFFDPSRLSLLGVKGM